MRFLASACGCILLFSEVAFAGCDICGIKALVTHLVSWAVRLGHLVRLFLAHWAHAVSAKAFVVKPCLVAFGTVVNFVVVAAARERLFAATICCAHLASSCAIFDAAYCEAFVASCCQKLSQACHSLVLAALQGAHKVLVSIRAQS